MKHETDTQTPYLGKKWKLRPGLVGKMTDSAWCYYKCSEIQPEARSNLHTISHEDVEKVEALSEVFRDMEDAIHTLIRRTGDHCVLVVDWKSYAAFKSAMKSQKVKAFFRNVKCCLYVNHYVTDGNCYLECVFAQVDLKTPLARTNKAIKQTEQVAQAESVGVSNTQGVSYKRSYSVKDSSSGDLLDCKISIQEVTKGKQHAITIQEDCDFNPKASGDSLGLAKVSIAVQAKWS